MDFKAVTYKTRWSNVEVSSLKFSKELAPSELLIKVSYIALNPIDVKMKTLAFIPRTRMIGKEFSGEVINVGSNAAIGWKKHDRICGYISSPPFYSNLLGTLTVINVNEQTAVMKTPFNLSDAEAASFPLAFSTSMNMLERTSKHGKLLVLGGGSNVGSNVIQLAKQKYQFTDVFATCSKRSEEYVSSLGATPINYQESDLSKKLTDLGIKFDAILDTVGGYDALKVWPTILKNYNDGGVYVTIAGDATVTKYSVGMFRPLITSLPWMVPRIILGKQLGINYQFITKKSPDWTKEASDYFAKHRYITRIAPEYGLNDCEKAWAHVDNKEGAGKVLIRMHTLNA